ncbi:MAG: Surfeit locus 1 family protein [Gemmatimonadetes bacterium]|nr:Surfeit locus 1 family protein [Gemmatimonadota bacterium]
MSMSRPIQVFCGFAVVAAVLFTRLGFWQLSRLSERQAHNAMVLDHQLESPAPFSALPPDTAQAHYRIASVVGRFDYDHELIISGRTRRGSPGVEFVTPVRVAGSDTAILVNRGWVYSPDAQFVERARWREGDSAHVTGYAELYSADTNVTNAKDTHVIRRMSRRDITVRIPYPVANFYIVAVGDTADLTHPARRGLPALDEGSHRGYAFQWFSFAAIALIGAGIVVRRERLSV